MRIAVIGSRDYPALNLVREWVLSNLRLGDVLVSGGAIGVDTAGSETAKGMGLEPDVLRPNYKAYPENMKWKAPLDRNTDIVKDADKVVAFWNCLPESIPTKGGTRDAINKALKLHKPVTVFFADGQESHPTKPYP